ncbi:hypothetical protein KUV62_17605 [Salipiger bermudensis]|uniref:hypothetical protein n=1 Tax=Salipiger bermudensis TaxID=344736 RepID=UPI001C9977CF|nr:hypothetical protein [Salipiger bermudensis]MBY6005741.1 hypothetical protein [Salipiger bermudensis]
MSSRQAERPHRAATALALALLLAGCGATVSSQGGAPAPATVTPGAREAQVTEVTRALLALGPAVDPAEAARAARIAVELPLERARAWQVTDPPLVHNFKVVNGLREKGVCQDFADALEIGLAAEGFRTLDLHRAIANARNLKLEHATVIVTARGQPMAEGLVLDPWRIGQGQLWVGRTAEDPDYRWESRADVRAWHASWKARASAGL